jgi:hypothetical protein
MDYATVILTASLTSISILLISVCLKLRAAREDLEVTKSELILLMEESSRSLEILKRYRNEKYQALMEETPLASNIVLFDSNLKKPFNSSFNARN